MFEKNAFQTSNAFKTLSKTSMRMVSENFRSRLNSQFKLRSIPNVC